MFRVLRSRWNKFCDTTTIHGIRHIHLDGKKTENSRCVPLRKVIWLLLIICMTFSFLLMLERNYTRFREGNTLTRSYKIYMKKVTFPSILLCPQISIAVTDFFSDSSFKWTGQFVTKLMALSYVPSKKRDQYDESLQRQKIKIMNLLRCTIDEQKYKNENDTLSCKCFYPSTSPTTLNNCKSYEDEILHQGKQNELLASALNEMESFVKEDVGLNLTKVFTEDIILDILKEVYMGIFKDNTISSMSEVFRKIHTRHGYCFKFDLNYTDTMDDTEKSVYNGGEKNGLKIALILHEKFYIAEPGFTWYDGMKVAIFPKDEEGNEELVEVFHNDWQIVPFSSQINIILGLKETNLLPTRRGMKEYESCVYETKKEISFWETVDPTSLLFEDSNPPELKNFKIYSVKKCKFECIMNRVIKEFNCVPLYIKQYRVYPNITTCSTMLEAIIENCISALGAIDSLCSHCKPQCRTTEYSVEMSHFKYTNHENRLKFCEQELKNKTLKSEYCKGVTFFNFYFKELSKDVQSEEFDFKFLDFMTSLGGYIGLFLGGSLLSLFELLSFLATFWVPLRTIQAQKNI